MAGQQTAKPEDDKAKAPAQKTGTKAPSSKDENKKQSVPALSIRAVPATGFRRCGFGFGKEPKIIPIDQLSSEQVKRLKDEPNLVVAEVETEAE